MFFKKEKNRIYIHILLYMYKETQEEEIKK